MLAIRPSGRALRRNRVPDAGPAAGASVASIALIIPIGEDVEIGEAGVRHLARIREVMEYRTVGSRGEP
jgi:hypothetical protein